MLHIQLNLKYLNAKLSIPSPLITGYFILFKLFANISSCVLKYTTCGAVEVILLWVLSVNNKIKPSCKIICIP